MRRSILLLAFAPAFTFAQNANNPDCANAYPIAVSSGAVPDEWVLSNTGGFVLGDNVRVIGAADAGCITACQQGGCISVSSITTCVTSVGVLYCPGDGTGAPCPCANSSPLGAQTGCLNSLNLGGAFYQIRNRTVDCWYCFCHLYTKRHLTMAPGNREPQ